MRKGTIEEQVKAVIVEQLNVDPEKVMLDSTLDSMGADSLDLAELAISIEYEMDVKFTDAEWDRLTGKSPKVADLVEAVRLKIGE